jgi:hypothetical protein
VALHGPSAAPNLTAQPFVPVGAPQIIRTLKEHCLHLYDIESLEEDREVIAEFIERHNRGCLLQR